MALGPKDLRDPGPEDIERANTFEEIIDSRLKMISSAESNISVMLSGDINERVMAELQKRYKKAGWRAVSFKYHSNYDPRDPREGPYHTITFSR